MGLLKDIKKEIMPNGPVRFATGLVISLGAAAAVTALMLTPLRKSKGVVKLAMTAGVFMLGCKAGDVAETYFNEMVDNLKEAFKAGKEAFIEEEVKASEPVPA